MSKRIDELWGKALDQAVPDTYSSLSWTQVEKIKAVFAELIVRECMSLCTDVEEDVELADYVGGFRDGALMCREDIKKHFGVEE